MWMVPAGATIAGGASVACGTAVGALPPPDEVAAVVGVGALLPPVEGTGVAVADEPQATSNAANNRTIA